MPDVDPCGAKAPRSTLADSRPDSGSPNLQQAVEQLHTSVEAMEIVIHGMDLDRVMLSGEPPNNLAWRRWAAQIVILKNMFWDIEQRVVELYWVINKDPPPASAP